MSSLPPLMRDMAVARAREAAAKAYAPYSRFQVGAVLVFADQSYVTGANVENASYGLSLCAETVAVAAAMKDGVRGGLTAVVVAATGGDGAPVTPCGRCRQVLHELASLGGTDPVVIGVGTQGMVETTLSALLPHAFGPDNLTTP